MILDVGRLSGTVADTQIAFGTGVDTIGGSADLTWLGLGHGLQIGGTPFFGDAYGLSVNGTNPAGSSLAKFSVTQSDGAGADTLTLWNEVTGGDVVAVNALFAETDLKNSGAHGDPKSAYFAIYANDTVTVDRMFGVYNEVGINSGTPTVTQATNFWASLFNSNTGGTLTTAVGYYAADMGGGATNVYSFWSDEQGVYRIKADNTFDSVYQAIPALYNPQFTKYTPGAANYERIVEYWTGNVATVGTEAGGTGTLRALNLIGSSVTINGVAAVTTTGSQALSNKTGNISQWTNDSGYVTSAGAVTSITGTANQIAASASTGAVTLSVPSGAQLSIAKLTNLTSNGFVKTSSGDGTLSIDTSTYLTTAVTSATGTSNQVTVSASTGAVTFSLPQDIATASTPRFARLGLGQAADATAVLATTFSSTATSGTVSAHILAPSFAPSATSTMIGVGLLVNPTYNYSAGTPGAGQAIGLWIQQKETANPTGTNYLIRASAGAAGTTDKFTLTNGGTAAFAGNVSGVQFTDTAATKFLLYGGGGTTGLFNISTGVVGWTSGTNPAGGADAFFARGGAAATIQMGADVNGAAVSQQLQAANGITGTDKTGGNLTIASGKGTGAGAVSSLIFQTPTVLGSGTTAQSLATRLTIASGSITVADATDFPLGSTTGTKWGTATSQKQSFWNQTPIVQPTTSVSGAAMTANAGTAVNDASTFAGYTVGQVVAAMRNVGLLA